MLPTIIHNLFQGDLLHVWGLMLAIVGEAFGNPRSHMYMFGECAAVKNKFGNKHDAMAP